MLEGKARGMEERPLEPRDRVEVARHPPPHAAVDGVADDRMSDRAQVDPNLMRPPGVNGHLGQGHGPAHRIRVHDPGDRLAARVASAPTSSCGPPDPGQSDRRCGVRPADGPRPAPHIPSRPRDLETAAPVPGARASCLATTISPEVPRSSRWTMPGRISPPIPLKSCTWCSSAFTTVPPSCPAAGCTTMPAGLSTTARSVSW